MFLRCNFLLLGIFTTTLISFKSTPKQEPFAIMAYYVPSDEYPLEAIFFEKLTHIIFSFTRVIDNKMQFENERYADELKKLVAYKDQFPHLKVMIACGGWSGSGGFSDMANDPESRESFVKSAIAFVNQYNLDGVDIDWEYPGLPGEGNIHRPEDKQNFTALMKELRGALNQTEKPMTLTFAAAAWEKFFDHIEPLKVMKYADYINLMTYDYATGGSPITNHHTNLSPYTSTNSKANKRSAKTIVNYCESIGINPKQLVIGGAFYGRGWKGVPPENNGLFQSNTGAWEVKGSYNNLKTSFENKNGYTKYWDSTAQAPYLYNAKDSIFISYDDTTSIRLKTKYAKEKELGGIMFWQLTSDSKTNGLLDAIYDEVIAR